MVPSLTSFDIVAIDPSSGKSKGSILSVASQFNLYISSTYDSSTNQIYAIMANETGFQLFTFDLNNIAAYQSPVPYGFSGIVYFQAFLLIFVPNLLNFQI